MPAFQLGKPLQFLALISLLLAGCDRATTAPKKDDADARPGINLPAEQARSLGIETQTLKAANYRTSITGYGVVGALDDSPAERKRPNTGGAGEAPGKSLGERRVPALEDGFLVGGELLAKR